MSMSKAVSKIFLQNKGEVFLYSEYEPDKKLRLHILDGTKSEAYSGQASDIDLRAQAAGIRMTFNVFLAKITSALFQDNPEHGDYLYCLEESDGNFNFKWKSIDSDETIINLGNIMMEKKNFNSVNSAIYQSVSRELMILNEKISNINTEMQESEKQRTEAMNLVTLATDAKENLEKELYAKFVIVLNEKKRKIRKLKCGASCGLNVTNTKIGTKRNLKAKTGRYSPTLFSDSSSGVDGNLSESKPGPSNTKQYESLFFDEIESVVPVTPSKIRKRNVNSEKKEFHKISTVIKEEPETKDDESDDDLLKNM